MTSQNLWSRYERHFVGITWHSVLTGEDLGHGRIQDFVERGHTLGKKGNHQISSPRVFVAQGGP